MPALDFERESFELAPCGLIVADAAGTIVQVNRDVELLLGFSRSELIGQRAFTDLLPKGSKLYYETYCIQLLLLQREVHSLALKLLTADGRQIPVLANVRLHSTEGGTPERLYLALFDASGRLAYEQELLAAKRRAEVSEERARTLAHTLQATLIPPSPPTIPGLDVAAAYRPAGSGAEVGGDFYDIFEIEADEWVVVIGDVSGKGAEAAVVTALARDTVRAASVRDDSPSAALQTLNDRLLSTESDRFCTAIVLRLRRRAADWECIFAVGGHGLPLLSRFGDVSHEVGEAGTLIGALSETAFRDSHLQLRGGDLLLLCTDGVAEGRHHGAFFGDERILKIIDRDRSAATETVEELLGAVLDFQDGDPRDDIAIVALRVPTS